MNSVSAFGGRGAPGRTETTPRSQRIWWALGLLSFVLMGFFIAWGGGWIRFTTDPRVVEIQEMHQDLEEKYVASGGPKTFVEAAAGIAAMAQIRQKVDALPAHLRPAAEKSGQNLVAMYFRGQMNTYFSKPPDQRRVELDRQIRQFEMLRKAWEASNAMMNMVRGGSPAGTAAGSGQQAGQSGGQQQAAQASANSEANRVRSRKEMIDRTSPVQRAQYNEYRRAMEERRKQLGLKN